jgi:alpha-L-arabinofuranosidase/outer membrane protein assembly factor BamB
MRQWHRLSVASLLALMNPVQANDWPQFRGPGAAASAQNMHLPDSWGKQKNIRWQADIPGRGWSSPVVSGNRVFLTAVLNDNTPAPRKGLYIQDLTGKIPPGEHRWIVYCLDFQTGKMLWSREAKQGTPATTIHLKNTYASESPVTDGRCVYVYFGNVGVYCYDLAGKELWSKSLGAYRTRMGWGTAASPVLHKDRLYVVHDNEEKSFLVALDTRTGEQIWKVERDEKSNWATPFLWENSLRTEIVTPGTGRVRSYDLNGQLLWELKGMSVITIPTPSSGKDLLYLSSGYVLDGLRPLYAIRPGAKGDISLKQGETANGFIAWSQKTAGPYHPSPLVYGGYVYVLYDRGFLACYDAETGKQVYGRTRIDAGSDKFTASPVAADGKLYCVSEDGDTFVLRAGPKFELLAKNSLEEMCLATPALAGRSLLLRTASKLYRVTAGVKDARLDKGDAARSTVKVTRDFLFPDKIDPLQYGQFVEYLCDLIPSMWAEKLCDGSFEGLTPYKFYYLKETDFRERPWYPTGATDRAKFTLDPSSPVSGTVAKKIAVTQGPPCTVGIAQDGIAIDPEDPCVLTCYLRQEGIEGLVTVRIHDEAEEYARCQFTPTGQWKKYRARLAFGKKDSRATLSITFRGPGTLWLDNASLMPEKTVGGWRPDVVTAVRALKPGIIRFGGSALDDRNLGEFDWRDTLGDPDRRKPFRAWGGLQPTGPGLEEIVQFCRAVGAEPLLCVRVSGKGPQDAADQVEYFNGSDRTPMGRLRAQNGHQEPYGIKYWQVGNERSGKDYEDRLPAFCQAMKKVDPKIQLLSSYPTAGVIARAGAWLDFVCPHHYAIDDLTGAANDLDNIRALLRRHSPDKVIKVAVTEWNTTAGDIGPRRAKLWSLANALACARYHNLLHRYGDLVRIANRSNLINSFCSGIIQTDNHRLYKTPTYYAQQLYATLAGNRALRIDSPLPGKSLPDLSATLSAEGERVTVFAINPTLSSVTRPMDLSSFGDKGQEATIWTLTDKRHADEPDVANSFAEPDRIVAVVSKVQAASARFDFSFPALSLTVIQWSVK